MVVNPSSNQHTWGSMPGEEITVLGITVHYYFNLYLPSKYFLEK
jgi:hypothetical protein